MNTKHTYIRLHVFYGTESSSSSSGWYGSGCHWWALIHRRAQEAVEGSWMQQNHFFWSIHTMQKNKIITSKLNQTNNCKLHDGTYRSSFNGRIRWRISNRLFWRIEFSSCLLLISSLVEDDSESLGRCRVVHVPFTEFRQGSAHVLFKIMTTSSYMKRLINSVTKLKKKTCFSGIKTITITGQRRCSKNSLTNQPPLNQLPCPHHRGKKIIFLKQRLLHQEHRKKQFWLYVRLV